MSVAMSPPHVSVRPMWGTMIRIEVREVLGEHALDPLWQWFQRVDDLFSTWRDDSEISRLARGELELGETSAEVTVVLELCEHMKVTSHGAFDIAFAADGPDRPGWCAIDPTGLVKGWAVDRAGELLGAQGVSSFAINAGGDILVRGRPGPHDVWRVGIQHPWQRDKTAATVGLTDGAVATSGNYERDDHVYDPRTGRPASGLASVSVVTSELARADGYATAALALGRDGMAWLATLPDVAAIGITDDHRVVKTDRFDELTIR
jgi:FAD:protein FMN transferase